MHHGDLRPTPNDLLSFLRRLTALDWAAAGSGDRGLADALGFVSLDVEQPTALSESVLPGHVLVTWDVDGHALRSVGLFSYDSREAASRVTAGYTALQELLTGWMGPAVEDLTTIRTQPGGVWSDGAWVIEMHAHTEKAPALQINLEQAVGD